MVDLPAQAGAHSYYNMYAVYVLKSSRVEWYYVGMTNNLSKRIRQHNTGQTTSTKSHLPLSMVYSKQFADRITARDYEKFLKIRSNKEKLISNLKLAEVAKLVDAHA